MKKKYDMIFLANIPSFYRVRLLNEISKKSKIFVFFIAKRDLSIRKNDFFDYNYEFDYVYITEEEYVRRKRGIKSIFKILKILNKMDYKMFYLTQWDTVEGWLFNLLTPKKKSCLVMESSIYESKVTGVKGFLKKLYVSRIKYGLPSGKLQQELLETVGMDSKFLYKTKGVGIFEREGKLNVEIEIEEKEKITDFLFVGRLSKEKNIEQLLRVFKKLPELKLTIIGSGPLEKKLVSNASKNIIFKGYQLKSEMNRIYKKHQVFLLSSLSEVWGLVVDEALYNGIPVILSNKVGCAGEIIDDGVEGYIYDVNSDKDLIKKIYKIINMSNYKKLKKNLKKIDFDERDRHQVEVYMKLLRSE